MVLAVCSYVLQGSSWSLVFFLRVREARLRGIEGNSARLKKVYLARDIELLNCWMFCPAADVTLFCISHNAFLLGFHGEKVLL